MRPTPPVSPELIGTCNPDDRLGQTLAGHIQLTGILGVGAYGTVYRARDVETNVEYAVKALNKAGLDPRQKQFQDREILLHFLAGQHPNVVSMAKILDSPECTYVVIEYCPEGDLFAKITEEGHYVGDDRKAKHVFLQILDAVRHCHSRGIFHRDLKPENILVKDHGWTVKLADFGLATQERITSDFGCGSTFYMSPECQQSNPKPYACYASAPNDIWSLGVILVNLTCGRNPWKRASMDDSTFRAFMRDPKFLQNILPISDEMNNILQRIFEINPDRRISIDKLYDAILRCPRFTKGSQPESLPPTPPYSPEASPVDQVAHGASVSDVPPIDPLPAQQYPSVLHTFLQPSRPTLLHCGLPTPPSSGTPSPQHSPYTYAAKPLASAVFPPYIGHSGFVPNTIPAWSRCGPLSPTFHVPTSACFWNYVSAY